jgi:hypothetical protein
LGGGRGEITQQEDRDGGEESGDSRTRFHPLFLGQILHHGQT